MRTRKEIIDGVKGTRVGTEEDFAQEPPLQQQPPPWLLPQARDPMLHTQVAIDYALLEVALDCRGLLQRILNRLPKQSNDKGGLVRDDKIIAKTG